MNIYSYLLYNIDETRESGLRKKGRDYEKKERVDYGKRGAITRKRESDYKGKGWLKRKKLQSDVRKRERANKNLQNFKWEEAAKRYLHKGKKHK